MPFSNIFVLLIFAGVVPVLAGSLLGALFPVFIVYNSILLLLWLVDLVITPGRSAFEVERVCEEKFSLGTDNEVAVKVRNNSGYQLVLELKDEVPAFFKIKDSIVKIKAVPHSESEGRYSVLPEKRGEFRFGLIHCRYRGILRLCTKKGRYNTERKYKVYPNLKDLRKYSIAALNKTNLAYGIKKSRVYGIGTDFESLREYAEGDDYRKINWMATARSNKFIVNTYGPEKNQQVFVLLDSSRVMNSEINYIKKLDYAINSAFLLADVAIKKGDNTGLLVFDSNVKRFVKPGKGLNQFQLIAENLYNVEENLVTADYKSAFAYLNEQQKRRSLLCIFTELFNTEEALNLAAAIKNIARRHVALVITIKDERLYEQADCGVKDSNDVFLKGSAIKLLEEREKIKRILFDSGIACIDVPPDRLSIETVNKYLSMKAGNVV